MCQARAVECNELREPSTMEITTVGLDIAKRVFQLHGVDAAGKAVLRRKLRRLEVLAFFKALAPCLVGIEACGTIAPQGIACVADLMAVLLGEDTRNVPALAREEL